MKTKIIWTVGIILSFFIRSYFIFHGSEIADIHSLHEMGELTLNGTNPYTALNYNSYPPLALYLEMLTIKLSEALNIPFYFLIKFWPNLADFFITYFIYLFLLKNKMTKLKAALWSLGYLLNPISILISSAHGQIDSIPTLLTLIPVFILTFYSSKKSFYLSALLLGLAVAVKPNPLVLLPLFVFFKKTNLLEKTIFISLSLAPLLILLQPFLSGNFYYVFSKLIGYSGSNDFGLPAFFRGIYYFQNHQDILILNSTIVDLSKKIFLLSLGLFYIFFYSRKNLALSCLLVYLLFISLYFGISAQYLSWVLPFAIISKQLLVIPFSIIGSFSLIGFYLFFNPLMIVNFLGGIVPYQPLPMIIYSFFNLALWAINICWIYLISIKFLADRSGNRNP